MPLELIPHDEAIFKLIQNSSFQNFLSNVFSDINAI